MDSSKRQVGALCAVQVIDVMGVTVVVSALPRMLSDLQASAAQAGLLVPVYAVGFSSLLLLSARLGDRFGHRRLLLIGLLVFAAGSVLAAVAPTMAVLVAGRAVQGVAAAVSVPNALVLLTAASAEGAERDRVLGLWNACGGLAGALGLLVGGLATSLVGWRAIFWANLAVTAVLVVAVLRTTAPDGPPAEKTVRIPVVSVVLQVTAIAAVVAAANLATGSWLAATVFGVLGVVAAGVLIVAERRTATPLVPGDLWTRPGFGAGVVGSFGITATTSAFVVVATVFLQDAKGFSPAGAGLTILPFSIAVVVAAAVAGRTMPAVGPRRTLVLGLTLIGVGAVLATVWSATPVVVLGVFLAGSGNGMGSVAAYAFGTAVPDEEQGSAAGLLNTAAQIGTAVVVAVVVAVASAAGTGGSLDQRTGWLVVCGTAVVVVAAVLVLSRVALTRDGTVSRPAAPAPSRRSG